MTILVDPAVWPWRGRRWAHLVSDHSYDELHRFADQLGLERQWFQGDHYDIPADVRRDALRFGATPVSAGELVRRLRAAGLRQGRRRSAPGAEMASGGPRVGDERDGSVDGASPKWGGTT